VTCSLRREEKNWIIDVADQGYGISEANMSKLFNRFVRLHEEGQPEEEGIGLGLVFVKTVVTRHNGSICVKSRVAKYGAKHSNDDSNVTSVESTDHGTTFSVTLPAQDAPED
jgi:signal transduction histidine kinase